ncbi:MAG: hypothetical protein FD134_491 [Gallionellaceae bacterium]|nr:MAG: hypothetical protein FD134_491 [Gallionellaceae bacterium]
MIFTMDGKQFEFPESELIETRITGVALVESGFVTEKDIAAADKDAAAEFQMLAVNTEAKLVHLRLERLAGKTIPLLLQRPEKVLVRSSRLYFELPDRSVSLSPPLGLPASHIECNWMFSWVPMATLQGIEPGLEKEEPAGKSNRICSIEGKRYSIPAERINKLTAMFMVGVAGYRVAEDDIARLDACVNDEFDKCLAQFPPSRAEVQRMRLYYQLPDGTITQEPPIGRPDRFIQCCSLLQSVLREWMCAIGEEC